MNPEQKIYIAGHRGLVGSAITRYLIRHSYRNLVTATSEEVDLREQSDVRAFFRKHNPECVIIAAAKVGGILANNTYPADYFFDNLMIAVNIIDAAYHDGVKKLLFLGSTCVYPRLSPQPLKEEYLLTGPLEPTNEWYAVAKIAGIKMCQAYRRQYGSRFIAAMPTNLYGPEDNFDLDTSHVMPALIRKFYEAKINRLPEVTVWGSGKPCREFLHVDDLADAVVFLMQNYDGEEAINIGVGKDIPIVDLAETIKEIVGYTGAITFDSSKPDGTPRKLVDTSLINSMGWAPKISLKEGIKSTVEWYQRQQVHNYA